MYHTNKVDLASMFSQPEEKLWLVVKHYNGAIEHSPAAQFDGKRGIKLEKNCVIKMGRVRLRVRDIDYADDVKPIRPILPTGTSPDKSSPAKKPTNSATKLKSTAKVPTAGTGNNDDFDDIGVIDLNEIKLIEEAQNCAAAMVQGRTLDQDAALDKALDKKRLRSAQKKHHSVSVDPNGNKILITEEGD